MAEKYTHAMTTPDSQDADSRDDADGMSLQLLLTMMRRYRRPLQAGLLAAAMGIAAIVMALVKKISIQPTAQKLDVN